MVDTWPSNEDDAIETLFRKYWKRVYAMCVAYSGDEEVAKDLTQDIFLSLWQRKKVFDGEENLEKYLAKTAKYRVLAHFRDNKVHSNTISESAISNSYKTDIYNPEKILNFKELADQAESAIKSLPEPSRTIFLLNREEEMTYQQIASQQGLSLKSIEFHISKALRILRKSLGMDKAGVWES